MAKLYELINPSDAYTFYADSIEVAGVAVALLSTQFGAKPADGEGESTPILFGWDKWFEERLIDSSWIDVHRLEIADALDSVLIGDACERADIEVLLEGLPMEKRETWRAERQDRRRSSMSRIGETAYENAKRLRRKPRDNQETQSPLNSS